MRKNKSQSYSKPHTIRNYRIKKNARPVIKADSKTKNEVIGGITFFTGLISSVFMINIYRVTIISWKPKFYFALTTGLFLTLLTRNSKFITDCFPDKSILYAFFYCIVAVGFFTNYLFFSFNYCFAFPEITYYSFPIKEKSSMPGPKGHRSEREPLVMFDYFGQEKELVFAYSQTSQVAQATKILISIKKGRLGFDIVSSRELLK